MLSIRNLSEFECFILVAKYQSFSKASEKLNMSKNSVSRFIANLEDRLGEKLFRRSTRQVHLTGFGEKVLRQSEKFWESLSTLESELSGSIVEPQGTLRILVSSALSGNFLYENMINFQKKFPKILLELEFRDAGAKLRKLDEKNIDLLFGFPHVAHTTDDWKHKLITKTTNLIVASPSLLKKTGKITKPEDLTNIPFVTHILRNPKNQIPLKKEKYILSSEPIMSASSFVHMKEMCKLGIGAALLGDSMVEEEIKKGELKSILPNLSYIEFSLYVFCRASEYSSQKIRAFMDFF